MTARLAALALTLTQPLILPLKLPLYLNNCPTTPQSIPNFPPPAIPYITNQSKHVCHDTAAPIMEEMMMKNGQHRTEVTSELLFVTLQAMTPDHQKLGSQAKNAEKDGTNGLTYRL